MNVVPLHVSDLSDIPAMLRRLADAIEAGDHGAVASTITVVVGDDIGVFGFGDAPNQYHAAGVLHAGIAEILGS